MAARKTSGTARCGRSEALKRLRRAEAELESAKLNSTDPSPSHQSIAGSSAVLAGIAASDAATCLALGEASRGQDHKAAVDLLGRVSPGGAAAASKLARLLKMKTPSQYDFDDLAPSDARRAIGYAEDLVAFARQVLER